MKLGSRYHSSKSWSILNLWWFRFWLQQYPSNKLKHSNVVLSKSMAELIDTFLIILQVNRKLKESCFILQYSTLKIRIKYLSHWKKKYHRSWGILIHREMQFKKQRLKDAQSWEVRQGSGKHVAAYENQIQAFFLPKELHKVSVSKVFEATFFFSILRKLMGLGLGKQTQHGENLTKRKQGCITIKVITWTKNFRLI